MKVWFFKAKHKQPVVIARLNCEQWAVNPRKNGIPFPKSMQLVSPALSSVNKETHQLSCCCLLLLLLPLIADAIPEARSNEGEEKECKGVCYVQYCPDTGTRC